MNATVQKADAIAALERAYATRDETEIQVACPCGENCDGRLFVAREVNEGFEGEPYYVLFERFDDGAELAVLDCGACGRGLAADIVVPTAGASQ